MPRQTNPDTPVLTLAQVDPGRLYTKAQVGEVFGVVPATVKRWIKVGKLSARPSPGGHVRVLGCEIQRAWGATVIAGAVAAKPQSEAEVRQAAIEDLKRIEKRMAANRQQLRSKKR